MTINKKIVLGRGVVVAALFGFTSMSVFAGGMVKAPALPQDDASIYSETADGENNVAMADVPQTISGQKAVIMLESLALAMPTPPNQNSDSLLSAVNAGRASLAKLAALPDYKTDAGLQRFIFTKLAETLSSCRYAYYSCGMFNEVSRMAAALGNDEVNLVLINALSRRVDREGDVPLYTKAYHTNIHNLGIASGTEVRLEAARVLLGKMKPNYTQEYKNFLLKLIDNLNS